MIRSWLGTRQGRAGPMTTGSGRSQRRTGTGVVSGCPSGGGWHTAVRNFTSPTPRIWSGFRDRVTHHRLSHPALGVRNPGVIHQWRETHLMPSRSPQHRLVPVRTKAQRDRDHDSRREAEQPWRVWYRTAQWCKARASFLAANPLCVMCDAKGRVTPATVVDHIRPHRGDYEMFWSAWNWQPLCASCHSRDKQRAERADGVS